MKKNFVTLNGMTLTTTPAIINYLNSAFDTFVTTSVDLYDPCVIYYFDDKWNIESWSPAILDELDADNIEYHEFNTVLVAYEFIRFVETKEKNNRRYGIFSFNNEAVVRINRPNRPYRKPRHENIDPTKTTLFRKPKERENRYMPVYSFYIKS